jgi:type IV conjugative transfer system protein TraE
MKESLYKINLRLDKSHQKLLLLLCGTLSLSVMGLSYMAFSKETHIIVIPPTSSEVYKISTDKNNNASHEYLEKMGMLVLHYLLDNTYGSVGYQHNQLLSMVTSNSYGTLKAKLERDKEMYKSQGIVTSFSPHNVDILHGSINVKGEFRTILGTTVIESKTVSYKIDYVFKGTKFLVCDWTRI